MKNLGRVRGIYEYSTNRFNILEMSDGMYKERKESCSVSLALVEDLQARKRTGNPEIMRIKSYDVYCVHPYLENALMRLAFSHRHYRNNEDKDFVAKATSFVNNVVFVEH